MPERKRTPSDDRPNICDYEGSNYRTEFWEGQGRNYEDRVERVALQRLLTESGQRFLEIGAGFGRLTDEYTSFRQIVLLDYSFSHLLDAKNRLGSMGDRYVFVAADAYRMPFRPGIFDGASMIRTIHHMSDVPAALSQVRQVLAPDGVFILEHANKRNLKAMVRYALGRQDWNPYHRKPVEFVELNFDFHPDYIRDMLRATGFSIKRRLPVSFFRLARLKSMLPTGILVNADSILQHTGLLITPSVFVKAIATGGRETVPFGQFAPDNTNIPMHDVDALFAEPETGAPLEREGNYMISRQTGARYEIREGIYDFKAPVD